MNRQPGFSVIELVISIMISAMLMTGALTIYQQISKSMVTMQALTQADITCTIVKNRLSQDLMGLCPLWFTSDNQQQPETSAKDAKMAAQEAKQKSTSVKPQNPNIIKNSYLYAQSKDKQFTYLTFITTSTLKTYTTPQYKCARVVYALKPSEKNSMTSEPDNKKLFILQRKEETKISNEFDKDTITQGEFYTIAKNISNCVFEYGFIDTPQDKRQQQPEQEWKLKWVNHWGTSDDMKESSEYTPTMPSILRVKMTIQENPEKPGKEHEFYCLLPQSSDVTFQSFAQKRYLEERNAKQPPVIPNLGTKDGQQANQPNDSTPVIPVIPNQP